MITALPLYKKIQEDIKLQITSGQLREGDRIPSESELTQRYFVSSITAKNALNGLVDEGIIYRVKGKGSFVASSPFAAPGEGASVPSHTIGAVFPTLSTRVEQVYLLHMTHFCRQRNSRLLIGCSNESPDLEISILRDLIQCGIQGLILFPVVSENNNAAVRQLIAHKFPFVFMDRYLTDVPTSYVTADNKGGAMEAATYMFGSCKNDVAIVHFPLSNTAVSDRLDGFRQAFDDNGFDFSQANQCVIDDQALLNTSNRKRVEYILEAILTHLRKYSSLRGLLAANAEIAQVAFYAVRQLGFTPSKDFELLSFDNPHLPGVHFVQQDFKTMNDQAMNLLFEQIGGSFALKHIQVPAKLVHVMTDPVSPEDVRHLVMGFNP